MANPHLPRDLERTRKSWDRFAAEDPFWAILTDPEKRHGGWDLDEFFRSGATTVDAEMERLRARFPDLRTDRALDFGCGVGRLTLGLAGHFTEVVGVDISERMIEMAESFNPAPARIRFAHNPATDLRILPADHFDLVLSLITLQHLPTRSARRYLTEFVRITRPGGLLVVQATAGRVREKTLKERLRRRFLRAIERLNRALGIDQRPRMEMNLLPEPMIRTALESAGAEVLEVVPDSGAGDRYLSLRYLARKVGSGDSC